MKKRNYDITLAVVLIILAIGAALILRFSTNRAVDSIKYQKLNFESFQELIRNNEKGIWFYSSDNIRLSDSRGLQEDTPINEIFITQSGRAKLYRPTSKVTYKDFEGFSVLAMIQHIENNMFPDITFEAEEETYIFTANADEDSNNVQINISPVNPVNNNDAISLNISKDSLYDDIQVGTQVLEGYFYQSENANRFLMFRVEALLTPKTVSIID